MPPLHEKQQEKSIEISEISTIQLRKAIQYVFTPNASPNLVCIIDRSINLSPSFSFEETFPFPTTNDIENRMEQTSHARTAPLAAFEIITRHHSCRWRSLPVDHHYHHH